jgi:hypothetical protein
MGQRKVFGSQKPVQIKERRGRSVPSRGTVEVKVWSHGSTELVPVTKNKPTSLRIGKLDCITVYTQHSVQPHPTTLS